MNKGQIIFGGLLVLWGLVLLAENLLNIDLGPYIFPLILVALGIWIIYRPKSDISPTRLTLVGDDRYQPEVVKDEAVWSFVADTDMNLSRSEIPDGVTRFRFYGFVGDIDLRVPDGTGVMIESTAFVSTIKANGAKQENMFRTTHWQNEAFASAAKKITIETYFFVSEIDVRS